ncbi:hemerythrin domain-containing protein [Tropicimonas sp. S265A]|uniref:hemerythrin domain-containing protein n=1 Tax=Tropicimonas sp. S265A TaxID=3415134 RepID=UPI003C7AF704
MDDRLSLEDRSGWPDALRVLEEAYPRAAWPQHPNFNDLVRFWLSRHLIFRRLLAQIEADTQNYMDGQTGFEEYAPRLSELAGTLLNELHAHHQIEDHQYFPRLARLDARITRGFEVLDADHHAMDGLLHSAADAANTTLRTREAGPLLDEMTRFGRLLDRHLVDEEDLIVPVILSSGFRG